MKIKIGIIFGGMSKEREISFAGGRTVYDNLNKNIFEPIPLFVDSFGNFVLLDWQYIYKGSVRDFYPPVDFLPDKKPEFQIYAESIGVLTPQQQEELISKIGKKITAEEMKSKIDFAFLCLHGPYGEDGRIQGLLEYHNIPYSGSGILPSSIGIDKHTQKKLMVEAGFNSPAFMAIGRDEYISGKCKNAFLSAKKSIGFPLVVKPANQGSSIGVTILTEDNEHAFMEAVEKAFFTKWIDKREWFQKNESEQYAFIKELCDIREGIGMPVKVKDFVVYHPSDLMTFLNKELNSVEDGIVLEALDAESEVLIEGFIEGKEFSCIVIQDENNNPVALPPTEIKKGKELFDYRSKYLPGLSRKITPINLPDKDIDAIRSECERLFLKLCFDVYARIDGFISKEGKVFLNDPNTTSGMMPSSFFFHQAAEIGLNPSQFLTYIIRTSVVQRKKAFKNNIAVNILLSKLDQLIEQNQRSATEKIKVAVLLGGYSSERHISVESGRNIYEKLSSSVKYEPFPVFLTGSNEEHELYLIPVNILLKDNADDIKEKINNYTVHPKVKEIIHRCSFITGKYSSLDSIAAPKKITYSELAEICDAVFIALHGRPGEDGAVQEKLDKLGVPYNGSGVESSKITIDKYTTNELLKQNGFLVAEHMLITASEWNSNADEAWKKIESKIKIPFIAKPVDDGCSSAVRKIKSKKEFEAFAKLMFRSTEQLDPEASKTLNIKEKEEFPLKNVILVEELISKNDAKHFLEITGGMLTHPGKNGEVTFEVFEASEALAEGEVLSLEEKFLAGQGQNITPARYDKDPQNRSIISEKVKELLGNAAKILKVNGYCRIDAFVRIYNENKIEVIFIEVNSLPGMTPATCIFHQTAINNYKPYEFIDKILDFAFHKKKQKLTNLA